MMMVMRREETPNPKGQAKAWIVQSVGRSGRCRRSVGRSEVVRVRMRVVVVGVISCVRILSLGLSGWQ
jgi:hypothetical protein